MRFDLLETLTDDEKQTYDLLCQNLTNAEIANRLDLSTAAIAARLRRIYRKLGVEAENETDKHAARRRAILYSGTEWTQTIGSNELDLYSIDDIRKVSKLLTWHDRETLETVIEDLILYLQHKEE